jgi:hypothetical protein
MDFPKIVHLIYIPWDKNQKLKKNYMDFDEGFYKQFKKDLKGWKVKLWTWDKIEKIMTRYYKKEWNIVKRRSSRPTMLVDYLRWKIVYHYGGIYWQYGSKNKKSLSILIPRQVGGMVLLTETELNIFSRYWNSLYRIRNYQPEEKIRIRNQVFSAYPKHKFIKKIITRILYNLEKYKVKEDYDILYICANAMISKIYNQNIHNINKYKIELFNLKKSNSIVDIYGKGSWRTDKKFI